MHQICKVGARNRARRGLWIGAILTCALAACSTFGDSDRSIVDSESDAAGDTDAAAVEDGGEPEDGGADADPGIVDPCDPAAYPAPPSGLPSLDLLDVSVDLSGGNGTAAAGGDGGILTLWSLDGGLATPGAARPEIDRNFLTAADLDGGVVTVEELIAGHGDRVTQTASTVYVEVRGEDFHLPEGVTLDLSSLAVDGLQIAVFGEADVIRIDGDVVGTRDARPAADLSLISHRAPGTAITIDGDLSLDGGAGGQAAGDLNIISFAGAAVVAGPVHSRGGPSPGGAGGRGGNVFIQSSTGDTALSPGILQTSGGDGAGGGSGGQVYVQSFNREELSISWGLRCDGGDGTSGPGGQGGQMFLEFQGPIALQLPYACRGGASMDQGAGNGGLLRIVGTSVRGGLAGSSNGGAGETGGGGGTLMLEGGDYWGLWVDAATEGGSGDEAGGNGGYQHLNAVGTVANLQWGARARGGAGQVGGNGGSANFNPAGPMRNTTVVATLSAGASGTGDGRNGGLFVFNASQGSGTCAREVTLGVESDGSAGASGGGGGSAQITFGGAPSNAIDLQVSLLGGAGQPGAGGNGGTVTLINGLVGLDATIRGSARGGNGELSGGAGGGLSVPGSLGSVRITSRGEVLDLRGGDMTGPAGDGRRGGSGGMVSMLFESFFTTSLAMSDFAVDVSGGDSSLGAGGDSGGLDLRAAGRIAIEDLDLECRGGIGSLDSGAGIGGAGGNIQIKSLVSAVDVSGEIRCSGGDGRGGGGDASPLNHGVRMSSAREGIVGAGLIHFDGRIEVDGGDGLDGAAGGAGGYISIDTQEDDGDRGRPDDPELGDLQPGGDIEWTGSASARGGDSVPTGGGSAAGPGGRGGLIELTSQGVLVSLTGDLVADGGRGAPGAAGGAIWLNDGAKTGTAIRHTGLLSARGGAGIGGTPVGGDGGRICVGVDSGEAGPTVTGSSTWNVLGGAPDGAPGASMLECPLVSN